jgi:hypothetical protein
MSGEHAHSVAKQESNSYTHTKQKPTKPSKSASTAAANKVFGIGGCPPGVDTVHEWCLTPLQIYAPSKHKKGLSRLGYLLNPF